MEEKGYKVNVHHQRDWSSVKQKFGMPNQLKSCHTAVVDGYMVEGHVPEKDIARLLSERPTDITGLTAPGMPQHSPGMAAPGQDYKDFNVIAFDENGNLSLYSKY
ncbi:putative periplasmic protein [Moritella sp. PE36]|nr:putative periplasmic protein [Moritella sp. PE36]